MPLSPFLADLAWPEEQRLAEALISQVRQWHPEAAA